MDYFSCILEQFLSVYSIYILSFDKKLQNVVKHKFDKSILLFCYYFDYCLFCRGCWFCCSRNFLPDIINNLPGLEGYGNITWTLVGLAGIPSCIIWMRLAHKYGSVNIIIIAIMIQTVGILIPTFTSNIYMNLFKWCFYGGTFVGL